LEREQENRKALVQLGNFAAAACYQQAALISAHEDVQGVDGYN
jgi:hypothetical protein